jgi:hypothetical protein
MMAFFAVIFLTPILNIHYMYSIKKSEYNKYHGGRLGRDHMVVGFITTNQ